MCSDGGAEPLAVGQWGGAVQAAELRQCRRDPVLGCAGRIGRERRARVRARSRWLAAEGLDPRTAEIELLRLICGQAYWLHQVALLARLDSTVAHRSGSQCGVPARPA